MKALVSPNEPCQSGFRIAEVEPDDKVFDVAQPLFWVDCANDVLADHFWYDPETETIKPVSYPEPEQSAEE